MQMYDKWRYIDSDSHQCMVCNARQHLSDNELGNVEEHQVQQTQLPSGLAHALLEALLCAPPFQSTTFGRGVR
eukprot:8374679-Alexandrium_andersonii.AAC.1